MPAWIPAADEMGPHIYRRDHGKTIKI